MSESRLHEPPRWGAVAEEQFRMLALSMRNVMLLLGGAIALATLFLVSAWLRAQNNPEAGFRFHPDPDITLPLIIAGFFVPLAVWKSEDPLHRGYHWAMPVGRAPHSLTRSFFGWIWFAAALAVYLLWLGVMNLFIGTGAPQNTVIEAWQWVRPFTAITITYLLGSVVVLSTDHPWRWFVGIPVGMLVLSVFSNALELEALRGVIGAVTEGRYGLRSALFGTLTVSEPVVLRDGREVIRHFPRPNYEAWLGATSLWMMTGFAGILAVASRHQER